MANRSFERTVFNPLEKAASSDWNQVESQSDRTLRELMRRLFTYRGALSSSEAGVIPVAGFVGQGLQVAPSSPAAMEVNVSAGIGFQQDAASVPSNIGGISAVDDLEQWKPIQLGDTKTITVPAADPTNPRIDIVEVKYLRQLNNPGSRLILNPATGVRAPAIVQKTLSFSLDDVTPSVNGVAEINYKTGVPAAVPVAPTTSAGFVRIASVNVAALQASIGTAHIIDERGILAPYGDLRVSISGTIDITTGMFAQTPDIVAPPGVKVMLATELLDAGPPTLYGIHVLVTAGDNTRSIPAVPGRGIPMTAAAYGPAIFGGVLPNVRPVVCMQLQEVVVFTTVAALIPAITDQYPAVITYPPGANILHALLVPAMQNGAQFFDQADLATGTNLVTVNADFTFPWM